MLYVPTISKQQEQLDGLCACQLWQRPNFWNSPPHLRSCHRSIHSGPLSEVNPRRISS